MSSRIYFTFPVTILKEAMNDIRKTCDDIMNYCGYVASKKYSGTIKEKMEKAGNDLGIIYNGWENSYNKGQEIANNTPKRTPMTSINHDIVFDFYDNHKSEFEIVTFLAFAGIRSILQMKPYTRITNDYLFARMAGYPSTTEIVTLPGYEPKELPVVLPALIDKYNTRFKLDKIKKELQNNWHMKLYGIHTHGFYVSFKLSLNQLVKVVEAKRKRNQEAKRKAEIQQALFEFETEIKTTT